MAARYLRKKALQDGKARVFPYTPELAKRSDMVESDREGRIIGEVSPQATELDELRAEVERLRALPDVLDREAQEAQLALIDELKNEVQALREESASQQAVIEGLQQSTGPADEGPQLVKTYAELFESWLDRNAGVAKDDEARAKQMLEDWAVEHVNHELDRRKGFNTLVDEVRAAAAAADNLSR